MRDEERRGRELSAAAAASRERRIWQNTFDICNRVHFRADNTRRQQSEGRGVPSMQFCRRWLLQLGSSIERGKTRERESESDCCTRLAGRMISCCCSRVATDRGILCLASSSVSLLSSSSSFPFSELLIHSLTHMHIHALSLAPSSSHSWPPAAAAAVVTRSLMRNNEVCTGTRGARGGEQLIDEIVHQTLQAREEESVTREQRDV